MPAGQKLPITTHNPGPAFSVNMFADQGGAGKFSQPDKLRRLADFRRERFVGKFLAIPSFMMPVASVYAGGRTSRGLLTTTSISALFLAMLLAGRMPRQKTLG